MTTPLPTMLTGGTVVTAAIGKVVSETRSYLLCKCLYQLRWLITFGPDWHCLMENKLAEPHLMQCAWLGRVVWSLRRDLKGDGYCMIRSIVRNESEKGWVKPEIGLVVPLWWQLKCLLQIQSRQPRIMCLSRPNNGCCALHIVIRSWLHGLPTPMLSLAKPALISRVYIKSVASHLPSFCIFFH